MIKTVIYPTTCEVRAVMPDERARERANFTERCANAEKELDAALTDGYSVLINSADRDSTGGFLIIVLHKPTRGERTLAVIPPERHADHPFDMKITAITRSKTANSGSPMWRVATSQLETLYIFKHNDPAKNNYGLFAAAGYGADLDAMKMDQRQTWLEYPIAIQAVQDGKFLKIVSVAKRPDVASPDSGQFMPLANEDMPF